MDDPLTNQQKRLELRGLYERLAQHHGWQMPQAWKEDLATMQGDIDSALVCLRGLVADQCEPLRNPETTVEI